MKTVGNYVFPENSEEAKLWIPQIRTHALSHNVLVAAKTRIEGKWAAYIRPVPGNNHEFEAARVLTDGTKLSKELALILFPCFKDIPYAL